MDGMFTRCWLRAFQSVVLLTLAASLGSSGGLHGYHTVRDVRCDYFICLGGSGASPSNRPGIAAAGSYPAQEYRLLTEAEDEA